MLSVACSRFLIKRMACFSMNPADQEEGNKQTESGERRRCFHPEQAFWRIPVNGFPRLLSKGAAGVVDQS